jgi:hypothetical protein
VEAGALNTYDHEINFKANFYRFIDWICIASLLQKRKSCENCINGNQPPIANAGPDQLITLSTDSVSLNGSSSATRMGK